MICPVIQWREEGNREKFFLMRLWLCLCDLIVFSSLILISSQVLTYPRDEPVIYSSNLATKCCEIFSSDSSLSSSLLLDCVNQTLFSFSSQRTTPFQVSIVSYLTKNILHYGALGAAINAIYAVQNNYQFRIQTPETGAEYFVEDQRWNKVKILEDALHPVTGWAKDSEYLIWLDSDLIFLDLGMKIEEIGATYPASHVIMSEDVDLSLGISNTGFIFVRNSPWSLRFLSAWWNNYNKSQGMDQYVLSKLYEDHKEEYQHYIRILPIDALNSHFPSWLNQQPANQILHLAGANKQMREKAFHIGYDKICQNINEMTCGAEKDKICTFGEINKVPRQLGLTRETLAAIDASLPRAQILRNTLKKIKEMKSQNLNANEVIQLLTELREDWTMHTHRQDISGGLDPDHNEKLLEGFTLLSSMLLHTLQEHPDSSTRVVDIQALLNTIYFIIVEISSLYDPLTPPHIILQQINLLLSVYPYLSELSLLIPPPPSSSSLLSPLSHFPSPISSLYLVSHSPSNNSLHPHTSYLLFVYKFFRYLSNFYLSLASSPSSSNYYSSSLKILLYHYQSLSVFSLMMRYNHRLLLFIDETNMNPLYDPYQEIQQDLDIYSEMICRESSYENQIEQEIQNERKIVELHILLEETEPTDEVEKIILQKIIQTFPKNATARVRSAIEAIELSISFYNEIWSKREYAPHEVISSHILRLLTAGNCYALMKDNSALQKNLHEIMMSFQWISPETSPKFDYLKERANILQEKYRQSILRIQGENEATVKMNRMTRRKLTTKK